VTDACSRVVGWYRSTLRTVLSWCVDRELFFSERARIRGAFEANSGLRDLAAIEKAVSEGERTLESYAHPDPYVIPTMYGGSKYARNPEVPGDVEMVFDFGREEYAVPK
jgi:NADH dehydrogenase (ubiquinone) 1 beta subcomplex subunit 9